MACVWALSSLNERDTHQADSQQAQAAAGVVCRFCGQGWPDGVLWGCWPLLWAQRLDGGRCWRGVVLGSPVLSPVTCHR